MCLSSSIPKAEWEGILPKSKTFPAYKIVNKREKELHSPIQSFKWKAGMLEARSPSSDNMAGFYVFINKPDSIGVLTSAKDSTTRILKLTIDREDVKNIGPDRINSVSGYCLVVTKLTLTTKDFEDALSGKSQKIEIKKKLEKAAKKIKKTKTKVAKKVKAKKAKTAKIIKKAIEKDKYLNMNDKEVRKLATKKKIEGRSKMSKIELIKKLKKLDKSKKKKKG